MKVKEESEKAGLELNTQKTNIMASGPITSRQIDGETMETVTFYFLESYSVTSDPLDYAVHGILQARILEWIAIPFSRGSSQPRD